MISKFVQIFKKYIWIPIVIFVSLFLYFIFRSKSMEKNISDFLEKNNENKKEKIVQDIKDRGEFEEDVIDIKNNENKKIEELGSQYNKKIEELNAKEEEEISKFEDMSNEDLANLLAEKYKLSKTR